MAISYVGAGATAAGTTGINIPYPTGLIAGDMLIIMVANKYPNNGPATPAGWTQVGQHSAGSGVAGADSGSCYVTIICKESDGTETGNRSVTVASGNSSIGKMIAIRKPADGVWAPLAISTSSITTPATNSTTQFSGLPVIINDFLLAVYAVNSDGQTFSGYTLIATGASFGAITEIADDGSAGGDDAKLVAAYLLVSEGSSNGPVNFGITANTTLTNAPAGPLALVRARVGNSPMNSIGVTRTRRSAVIVRRTHGATRKHAPDMEEMLGRKVSRTPRSR